MRAQREGESPLECSGPQSYPWQALAGQSFLDEKGTQAIKTTLALLDASAGYIGLLDKLAVDRREAAEADVKSLFVRVEKLDTNLQELLGEKDSLLGPSYKAQKEASTSLLSLLHEWQLVSRDAKKIRKIVDTRGEAFINSLKTAGASLDVWQKLYTPLLTEYQANVLSAEYEDHASSMSYAERKAWLARIASERAARSEIDKQKPLSSLVGAIVDSHGRLVRILKKELTDEERQEVRALNAAQFERLAKATLDIAKEFL
jgi:hypothetical protein